MEVDQKVGMLCDTLMKSSVPAARQMRTPISFFDACVLCCNFMFLQLENPTLRRLCNRPLMLFDILRISVPSRKERNRYALAETRI